MISTSADTTHPPPPAPHPPTGSPAPGARPRQRPGARARGVPLDAARRLHRRVQEALDLGEGDDLIELSFDLVPVHAHAKRRAVHAKRMLARPVSSGALCEPVPRAASCKLATRSWILRLRSELAPNKVQGQVSARPLVGSVMRERILSSVLLPAPLRPMPVLSHRDASRSRVAGTPALHHTCPGGQCQGTQCGASVPTTAPRRTSKETSLRAQRSVSSGARVRGSEVRDLSPDSCLLPPEGRRQRVALAVMALLAGTG